MLKSKNKDCKKELSIVTKYGAFYTGGNVQFTKDGSLMLCSCGEQVTVVNVEDGKVGQTVGDKESGEELSSFLLADDDETLITAARNGILKQWNLKSKTQVRAWKSLHIGKVACMAFDPSITLLATGGSDSTIKVWDIHQKFCTHNLKGASGVFSVVCFQTINSVLHIIGAADDYGLRIWDLNSSRLVGVLESHCSTVTGLLFIDEKNVMLSCSRDKVIIMWDMNRCLTESKPLKIIPVFESIESIFPISLERCQKILGSTSQMSTLQEDDIYFVTAGEKGVLKIWAASSGRLLHTQENSLVTPPADTVYDGQVITQASYVAALNAICVVTFEHNIVLYKVDDFELYKQFVGYNDDVLDIKLMGKNDSHLAVATNSQNIKVFELATFSCQLLKGHLDIVVCLDVFLHDRCLLLSGSKDNNVLVWRMDPNTSDFNCIFIGYGHTHSVGAVACSRGKSKFFLSGSEDNTLKLWDIPKKISLVTLKSALNARQTIKAHDKTINSIDVSLNDKLAATGSQDSTAKLWDATDLSLISTLRGHKKGIWCVKFSPVDLVLATSSGDGNIKIWSLSDYTTLKTFEAHEASILKVLFISKGTQLISSAADGLLKLWDIKNNECMKTYDGHDSRVWALEVSLNEEYVISGAADSNIIVWKDVTEEEMEKEMAKQEEFLLREQDLSNLVQKKKWRKALGLAIILDKPYRALNIINEILLEKDGNKILEDTIAKMKNNQIEGLLNFSLNWNTNSKQSLAAQLALNTIFKMYTTEEFLKIPERRSTIEALLPYTERHYQRLNKMLQDAHILNFLWQNIKVANMTQDDN